MDQKKLSLFYQFLAWSNQIVKNGYEWLLKKLTKKLVKKGHENN